MAERLTHVYNRIKSLKTVSHYQLQKDHPEPVLLSEAIKLTLDKSYYQISGNLYALHLRGGNKWLRSSTPLKPVNKKDLDVCIGSMKVGEEKSLLICQFSRDGQQLIIDVFLSFYPDNEGQMKKTIESHSYYY